MNSCAKKLAQEFTMPFLNTDGSQQRIVLEVSVNNQSSRDDKLRKSQSPFQAETVEVIFLPHDLRCDLEQTSSPNIWAFKQWIPGESISSHKRATHSGPHRTSDVPIMRGDHP